MKEHKARVFIIRYCIGGEVGEFGGKLPPRTPPVDETLTMYSCNITIIVNMVTLSAAKKS